MGRVHPPYMIYAITLILGLAGGLWVGSRNSSASLTTTSEAAPVAKSAGESETETVAKTQSVTGVNDPLRGAVNSTPGVVENPIHVTAPVRDDEHTSSLAPPVAKTPVSKDSQAKPSAALAEPYGGKAAIGSYVSAGRDPERRPGSAPCRLLLSERSLSIRSGGGSDTITVSSQSVDGPARVTASTKNWPDIVVFPDSKGHTNGPARYSVISVSKRAGTYAVNFASPCGMKTVPVTVQ